MTAMVTSVLSMIQARARENPLACAIVDGGRGYTYAELVAWSAAIERQLKAADLAPGAAVAVRMARGAGWIAAMLGVLRAGMIYVPVNPQLPIERRRQMCRIAGAALVLADSASADAEATDLVLAAMPADTALPGDPLPVHPQALAYLIFTSGTSGVPKAVRVAHGNLAVHAGQAISRYALSRRDRVLQTCAIGFDISLEEVIPTLCVGAAIVIAPDHAGQREGGLTALLDAEAVTVANLPTALWSAWVDEIASTGQAPHALRCLIVGGEACPVAKVATWLALEAAASIVCINAYGPTETTITATAWTMRALPEGQLHAPIGQPLPAVDAHVLDQQLQACAAGELYLGGALVADGYHDQPATTAAVFLPDPFASRAGARMYRSGDCVRLGGESELVLTGRSDRQFKLRGHRIEPAEIERRLEACGLIAAVAVKLVDRGSAATLVAYVVPRAADAAEVRFHAADVPAVAAYSAAVSGLPEYMRPRCYAVMPALPLNANGKTDFAALPCPFSADGGAASAGDAHVADVFCDCLQQSLGYLPDDLTQTFHAAGGDSIQAVRLLSLLRSRGWQLDAGAMVSTPLHAVGALLRAHARATADAAEGDCVGVALSAAERDRLRAGSPNWGNVQQILAATPVQISMLYRSLTGQREGRYLEQVEGVLEDLDVVAFQTAWRRVIAQYAILRASFAIALRDKPLFLVGRHVEPDWSLANWLDPGLELQERVSAALARDRARGFDLLVAPLMRFHLAEIGPRRYHFIWTYHHALLDGWSDIVVLDSVFDQYLALTSDGPAIAESSAPFADYVLWLQRQDRSAAMRYWSGHLSALPARRLWLLVDPGRTSAGRSARLERSFDVDQTRRYAASAQGAGITLYTLLLTAWACAVGAVRGTRDVVLGTVLATRPPELSDRIVGPLVNLLPLRLRLAPAGLVSADWLAELQRAQAERQVHHHQDLDLLTGSDPTPLFDTLFVFENYPRARHQAAAALRSHTHTEYPLNLLIWPGDGLGVEMLHDPDLIDQALLDELWRAMQAALDEFAQARSVRPITPIIAAADETCLELVI